MAVWTRVQLVQCTCYGTYELQRNLTPSLPVDPRCIAPRRISTEPTHRPRTRRNTQIKDTCIIFKQWHISSRFVFALSFVAIIFISLGYEYLRAYQRSVDRRIALALSRGKGRVASGRNSPSELSGADVEDAGLLSGRRKKLSSRYAYATFGAT
jgi:hypothetical protein